jgi:hypothetical protein
VTEGILNMELCTSLLRVSSSFLSKVYGGSVGLMVVFLAGQKALTKDDTHEL